MGADPDAEESYHHRTALSYAAESASASIVRLLLEHNADMESRGGADEPTSLLLAAKKGTEVVARLLLEKGAQEDVEKRAGLTPRLAAAKHGHGATAKALLEYGAPVQASDADGLTALHHAAIGGFRRTAPILLDHPGVEPGLADGSGKISCDLTRPNTHEELAKLLEGHSAGGRLVRRLRGSPLDTTSTVVQMVVDPGSGLRAVAPGRFGNPSAV